MGEADLALRDRGHTLLQALHLHAGTYPISGCAAGHVADCLEALDRGVEALPVALIGPGEPGCQPRELELFLINPETTTDQLVEHLGASLGYKSPLPTFHALHCTNVCLSGQGLHEINFRD